MSKKSLIFILIIGGLLLFTLSLFLLSRDLSPSDQKAEVLPMKSKKWNPGHYLQGSNNLTPEYIAENLTSSTSANMMGMRVSLFWGEWETSKDVYDFKILDSYIEALPKNKRLIIMVMDRDYWGKTCNGGARLPKYIMDKNQAHPAMSLEAGCVSQFWESDIQERWVKALRALGDHVDNNPQVEAIMLQETAFGFPKEYEGTEGEFKLALRDAFINIHKKISSAYPKTQVFQQMNYMGPRCQYLDLVADELLKLGHGLSNPDSPPQDSLPWDCGADTNDYHVYYKLAANAKPKPVYSVYRRLEGNVPIMVGGDTSQFGDPERPIIFNGESLNYDNLVKYLYLTAVKGYTYTVTNPDTEVTSHGANYMLWNTHFNSIDAQRNFPNNPISPSEYSRKYKEAYSKFLSNPNTLTNKVCPKNINCIGSTNPSTLPSATSITPDVSPSTTPLITPMLSITPTIEPLVTASIIPSITTLIGNKCGKADVEDDGMFRIGDFSEFARKYGNGKNACGDTAEDHLSYGLCGGRDVNKDGILNIADFGGAGIGFAQRYYPKTSCAL